jgi:hypothetical protein
MTTAEDIAQINTAMDNWQQGDFFCSDDLFFIHLANLARPLTHEAAEIAEERHSAQEPLETEGVASAALGYAVITQTCDIVRNCTTRSLVALSPLIEVNNGVLKEIQLLRRPGFAFIPGAAGNNLVADLDKIITVEKSFLSQYRPERGCTNDQERRAFADALARHRNRPAFADDFNQCMIPLRDHLKKIHRGSNEESALIQSIGEIRVSATPDWGEEPTAIFFWFILHPAATLHMDASPFIDQWLGLFSTSPKYSTEAIICRLEDITALDYVSSDRIDLDQISAR